MTGSALSLTAYRTLASLSGPFIGVALRRRIRAGKEDPGRQPERRGIASRARPPGPLLWMHGASVGESLSALPLIEALIARAPNLHVLVTTGTTTSAQLMADRLPEAAFHQYAPIDHPRYVNRFLDHWRPDAVLFLESELWPVMLHAIARRGLPSGLLNGRLSPKSAARWDRRPRAARELFGTFAAILGQDTDNAERISRLSGRPAQMVGNLKRAAAPLPVDEAAFAHLREHIGGRNVWIAASTHAGEERYILDAHLQLRAAIPDLLTIIAPRHPARGDAVEAEVKAAGLPLVRRSRGEPPSAESQIYLADTLGELGLLYRLADVAFIGGSLNPVGGHNPMEPARLGTAIITGPHVFNFQDTFQSMRQAGALALVRNERDVAEAVQRLLADPRTRQQMAENARQWAEAGATDLIDGVIAALHPVLGRLLAGAP